MIIPSSRTLYWLLFGSSVFLMAVALYMEHQMALEPCPLCIFQRVMVISAGTIALIAALHNPKVLGIRLYGALVTVLSLLGAGLAVRQLWLQSLPESEVPACGPGLDYLLDVFPLTEVLTMVLSGDGSCAEIQWTLLGISIPGWTLIGFMGLIALGIFQMMRPQE